MKQITLLIAALIVIPNILHAQDDGDRAPGDMIVSDDFSEPSNWIIYTEGDTEPEWEIVLTTPENISDYMFGGGEFPAPTAENGFAVFDGISYLLDGAVEPIDALIEYQGGMIDCADATNVILEFYLGYRPYFSDQVFVEVTNDEWVTFEAYELHSDLIVNAATVSDFHEMDITSIAAGMSNVKVRFRFIELGAHPTEGSGYGTCLDDFKVKEAWDFDQKISASYHRSGLGISNANGLEYYMIPQSQITEIIFAGITQNFGGMIQPNTKLNVQITGAGTYTGMSTPADLMIGGTDSLTCSTTFTPAAIGNYNIAYWFDSDEIEEETDNDTLYDSFEVMPDWGAQPYARDNGAIEGSIQNILSNTGAPFLIGNLMDIYHNVRIEAIDIGVSNDSTNVGRLIFAQIMEFDEESETYVYIEQTDDHEITFTDNGGIIRLFLDDLACIDSGRTIIVCAGHYGGINPVHFSYAQATDFGTVLAYTSGATEPISIENPHAIIVRPIVEGVGEICDASIPENQSSTFTISQNIPNPFNQITSINYELYSAEDVIIEITDVTGQIIRTIQQGNQAPGVYSLEIDGASFANGIYFYTFSVGTEKITKRMIVRH